MNVDGIDLPTSLSKCFFDRGAPPKWCNHLSAREARHHKAAGGIARATGKDLYAPSDQVVNAEIIILWILAPIIILRSLLCTGQNVCYYARPQMSEYWQ